MTKELKTLAKIIKEFYADPDNQKKFEEWKVKNRERD